MFYIILLRYAIASDCGGGCGGEMCNIPYGTIPSLFSFTFPSSSLFSLFSSFSLFLSVLLLCLEPLLQPHVFSL